MGKIRGLCTDDVVTVAKLFQKLFRNSTESPPRALVDYLRWHYLEMPGNDPEITALVHVDSSDRITGFIGVNALDMSYRDRRLRGAVCSSLMVDDRANNPSVGARLLKAFLAGPQDISTSETASVVSMRMWTALGGVVLPQYSFDWVRMLRPGAFLVDKVMDRFRLGRLLIPFGRAFDRFYDRCDQQDRWSSLHREWSPQNGASAAQIDITTFCGLVEPMTRHFSLRPNWAPDQLEAILACAREKRNLGELILSAVNARNGQAIGAFAYYLRPGRAARVLQILAHPGRAGLVIDCLVSDAVHRGASVIRGRTQPALMEAMIGRRIALFNVSSTVVHCRDADVIQSCRNGELFFNGVAGESWNRIIDGSFDRTRPFH